MTGVSRSTAFLVILLAACSPAAGDATLTDTSAGSSATTPSPSLTAPAAAATLIKKPAPSWTAAPEPTDIPPLPQFLKHVGEGGEMQPEQIEVELFLPHVERWRRQDPELTSDVIQRFTPAFNIRDSRTMKLG
ncbi:MAG: hypothetical protein ACK2UB_06910, partial [Anaerolineales bacterium]